MQRVRDFGQNLDPAMLFARGLGQPRSFQQAAQLACQDSGLRRQIVIEESWVRVMQENGGTDYFISDHQWSSHDRARMKFSRHAITKRVGMVDVNRPATANRFHRDGAFSGLQTSSTEMLRR